MSKKTTDKNSQIKEEMVVKYVDLTRKLGKLPSQRDFQRFGVSKDKVSYHFETHNKFKNYVLERYPEFSHLEAPVQVSINDIDVFRTNLEKSIISKQNKLMVENVNTLEYISQFAENVFAGRVSVKTPKKPKIIKRIQTLVLSDLHFGADLKGDETGTCDFGTVEEARRFAAVIKQAATYKEQYRKDTKLVVILAGDIIENAMHDPRTGAVLSEQCCRAIHLLLQGLSYLASFFPEVQVECATGNHDRNTSRHHGRAVHQKFDSFSTIIYYALKSALKNVNNITINIPKTPLAFYEVFGKRIGYTHGDTVLKAGGIYSTVNVKSLEAQINKINAALPDNLEYSAIVYGHTHIAHTVYLSNGCVLIGNGALPPADHFAVSIGSFETSNGQWIFESVEGYPVGDLRLIRTGQEHINDESLDEIIMPWKGL